MKFILNLPRKALAHTLNIFIAIPLTFIGILVRALAEWLNNDNRSPIATEPTNTEYLEAIEYLTAELAKQEEAIKQIEDEDLWDIEVELEEMENLGEDDGEKTIH